MKLTNINNCHVLNGKTIVAISYLGEEGYTMKTLQGMDRDAITARIITECPEFAEANNVKQNIRYGVFSSDYGKKYLKRSNF